MFLALRKQSQKDQNFNYPFLLSDFEARLDYTEEEGKGGREDRQVGKNITANVDEEVEKLEPSSIAGGNTNRCSCVGSMEQFLKLVKCYLRSCPFYQAHSQNGTLSTESLCQYIHSTNISIKLSTPPTCPKRQGTESPSLL